MSTHFSLLNRDSPRAFLGGGINEWRLCESRNIYASFETVHICFERPLLSFCGSCDDLHKSIFLASGQTAPGRDDVIHVSKWNMKLKPTLWDDRTK